MTRYRTDDYDDSRIGMPDDRGECPMCGAPTVLPIRAGRLCATCKAELRGPDDDAR